jgi:hypothetical protein
MQLKKSEVFETNQSDHQSLSILLHKLGVAVYTTGNAKKRISLVVIAVLIEIGVSFIGILPILIVIRFSTFENLPCPFN